MGFSRYRYLLRCVRLNNGKETYVSRFFSREATKESLETLDSNIRCQEQIPPVHLTLQSDDVVQNVMQKTVNHEELSAKCADTVTEPDSSIQVDKIEFCKSNNIDPIIAEGVELVEDDVKDLHDAIDDIKVPGPLDPCDEDLSYIQPCDVGSLNLAKYVNNCKTLRELLKLGVELYRVEQIQEIGQMLLRVDYDKDIKPYIQFLHDCGVPPDMLGRCITKNPLIFKEDMDDLHTRIRYLRAHNFTVDMISRIVTLNPQWLSWSTEKIDFRLGFFQHSFKMKGAEIRQLATQAPKIITYKLLHLKENTFVVREEMGFDIYQTKKILLSQPYVWIICRRKLTDTSEFIFNVMKLTHEHILAEPKILLMRKIRLERRHTFLVELKKAQYDPTKPLYVSPLTMASGTDAEFCINIAKVDIEMYNEFLKTL